MSLTTRLNSIGLEEKDPALYLLLKSMTLAIDRLNVNFSLSYDEPTALLSSNVGAQGVDAAVNVAPDVLMVKAIRFLGDRHGLVLESSESMGCRIWRSTDQSIASGAAFTTLVFDNEFWDTDDMHDQVTNTSRITINHAGRYIIGGRIRFELNNAGPRAVRILKNGADIVDQHDTLGTTQILGIPVTTIDELVLGDYLELQASQTSGVALNVVSTTAYSPVFWAHRVS